MTLLHVNKLLVSGYKNLCCLLSRFTFSMGEQTCQNIPIRTFVVMDLETTGLYDKPIKITEIAMIAAMREHIKSYGRDISQRSLPRVLSKLNICVYPRKMISQVATDVSGLSNELLQHQESFNEDLFIMLDSFIKRLPQPVCLIAHNGIRFDFPLLQQEIHKLGKAFPDHILCADSLPGFRKLLNKNGILHLDEVQNINKETKSPTVQIPITASQLLNNEPIDDIFKDISPLIDTLSNQNKTNTVSVCKKPDSISELGESELHVTDYDEALASVLETIESSPEYHKSTNVDEPDASALAQGANRPEMIVNTINSEILQVANNFHDLQKNLEKSPEACVTSSRANKGPEKESRNLQQLLEHTPSNSINQSKNDINLPPNKCNVENIAQNVTPVGVKRNNKPIFNRVRKRLNFSSEEENTKPKSFKLGDIYRFLLKKEPVEAHRAENDSLLLLECIVATGDHFLEWADTNSVKFNSLKKF